MTDGSTRPRLLLVDGYSLLFRVYHSIKTQLTSRDGTNVAALYGAVRVFLGLLERHKPDRVAFVLDAPGPTFRDEIFPAYKANRPPAPPELRPQADLLRRLFPLLGWPLVETPGYEADDAIAALTKRGLDAGYDVRIFTHDKDLMQLIGPRVVHIAHGRKGEESLRDAGFVRERFGVGPERMRDLLALAGDSSDNLPGVPGVGPKTAAKLLADYTDLEGVLAHAADLPGKLGENLIKGEGDARLTWKMVGLAEDAPVPPLDELVISEAKPGALEMLQNLRFAGVIRDLGLVERTAARLEVVSGPPEGFVEKVRKNGRLGIALEVEGGPARRYRIKALGLAAEPGVGYGLACDGEPPSWLTELFADEKISTVGYDLKPIARRISRPEDLMLAGWLLEADRLPRGLASLCQAHLGKRPAGEGAQPAQGDLLSDQGAELKGLAGRAAAALELQPVLAEKIKEFELDRVYGKIELPLLPVIAAVEERGLLLDSSALGELSTELHARMEELEKRAHELAGHPFNVASTKQTGEVLFGELKLPGGRRTKTGFSTAGDVLEKLAAEHEIAAVILEHRQLGKLDGTYAAKLPAEVDPVSGRLHTTLHQAAVATGRLSSSDPNLQNIPIRTELGRRIRKAFVAPAGCVLVSADYSQIELRLLAHISGEVRLLEAFHAGADIHAATAAVIFGVEKENVGLDQRNAAKVVNYSLIYGKGVYGLASDLGIGRAEAKAFIDGYFAKYPAVRAWMDSGLERARELGYTVTLFGRRRPFGELNSSNRQAREAAERAALNAPLQGTAADICKLAMIRAEKFLDDCDCGARLLLQIHDELLVECPEEETERVGAILREAMENACEGLINLQVPLVVEVGSGRNWLEAH
ncbi:MAG TPA: DNA polymerase I [bacterium]|nr:DNA polymerase I [bacterium]